MTDLINIGEKQINRVDNENNFTLLVIGNA